MSFLRSKTFAWLLLAGLLGTAVAIVWLAPEEQTLGSAIKYVYVHVALTRAGMYGIYLAGILGLVIAITNRAILQQWTQKLTWVAYLLFLAGGIVSLMAERVSWGGIPWSEPRNVTTLNVLTVGIITLILAGWVPWVRLRGLLYTTLAAYAAWVIPRTPLVLHPEDAVGTSTSALIQWTFAGLTALCVLIGAWMLWYWTRDRVATA